MNKKYFFSFIYFFIVVLMLYILYTAYIYAGLYSASKQLNTFENTEFLRIKIYGSSETADGNTISATFSIIDSNSNEIAVIERSWAGSYLGVEFDSFSMNGKQFVFPSKIYGKNHIFEQRKNKKKATALEKYYNENKQCMLYGYGSSYLERHMLYKISSFTTRTHIIPVLDFGFSNKFIIDLSNCKTGCYYSIFTDDNKRLYLQEL